VPLKRLIKADVLFPARFGDWNNWWRAGRRKIRRGENKRFVMGGKVAGIGLSSRSTLRTILKRVKQPVEMTGGEGTGLAEIWRLINVVRFWRVGSCAKAGTGRGRGLFRAVN
jgi:hypothetical protein